MVEQFRRAVARGRLATSFLFVGPEGIGKRTFAVKLAQALLCPTRADAALDPCLACPGCQQVAAGTHPDLLAVSRPEGKSFIPLELLIGDPEHRMREGLCHEIGLKPMTGGRKIAVIDQADFLNQEGANCLLKTLEEPPPRSVLILIGTSPARQLPTIRSRCQVIRFRPLSEEQVAEVLRSGGLVADAEEARRLAAQSGGSVGRALQASADPEAMAFCEQLVAWLAEPRLDSVRVAAAVQGFVQEAGTAAAARRERVRQAVGAAVDFYRDLICGLTGAGPRRAASAAADRAARFWPGDAETAADCLDRCLEALAQIDRNANQATLIEAWLDGLAVTASGR